MKLLFLIAGLMLASQANAAESGAHVFGKTFIGGKAFELVIASGTGYGHKSLAEANMGFFSDQKCFTFGAKKYGYTPGMFVFNGKTAERSDNCKYLPSSMPDYNVEFLKEEASGGFVYLVPGYNNYKLFSL